MAPAHGQPPFQILDPRRRTCIRHGRVTGEERKQGQRTGLEESQATPQSRRALCGTGRMCAAHRSLGETEVGIKCPSWLSDSRTRISDGDTVKDAAASVYPRALSQGTAGADTQPAPSSFRGLGGGDLLRGRDLHF